MQDPNNFEKYDPPKPGRVTGYRCAAHGFESKGKAALQLHMGTNIGCTLDVLREDPAPKPDHQCEPWQMAEHDEGWLYCTACGKRALPAPAPEPAERPKYDRHNGPHWEHDCEACIFLGSRPHYDREYDLYFCNAGNTRNVIARHGIMGDYVSGMPFLDREPMLAVAAILALKAGHFTIGDILGTRR